MQNLCISAFFCTFAPGMAKRIEYMMPVEYLSGNLSGRQEIAYGVHNEAAYDVQVGTTATATNYQARLIACRRWAKRRSYFCVRTKTSVNMSSTHKHSLALLGGAGALYGALLRQKSAPIYNACVNAWKTNGVGTTLRGYIVPLLIDGLSAKDADIAIADGVTIVNPWISSASPNVPVSSAILDKFNSELSNS